MVLEPGWVWGDQKELGRTFWVEKKEAPPSHNQSKHVTKEPGNIVQEELSPPAQLY